MYVERAKAIWEQLHEEHLISLAGLSSLPTDMASLSDTLGLRQLSDLYGDEIRARLETELAHLGASALKLRQLDKVSFYEQSLSAYSCFFLFWLWEAKTSLSVDDLESLMDCIYLGTIGYRLVDLQVDGSFVSPTAVLAGLYFIRLHESRLFRLFPADQVDAVLTKHLKVYTEVECIEKAARFGPCPFSYADAHMLGGKTAPLFALFELTASKSRKVMNMDKLLKGLYASAAAIQLMDDFTDAAEDLASGYETIPYRGFLEESGSEATSEKIMAFRTPKRIGEFFRETLALLDESQAIFEELDDVVLVLFILVQKWRFLSRFEIVSD